MTDSKSDAVLHLAVYGTLRDDCPAKMPYRAPFVKGSKAAHGTVRDYELWDNGVNQWPFALPAREGKGSSGAFIKVRLLSWGDAEAFAAKLREADKIEGVDPATGKEDAELFEGYYRERVTAIEDSSGKEVSAWMYVSTMRPTDKWQLIPGGDWLRRKELKRIAEAAAGAGAGAESKAAKPS